MQQYWLGLKLGLYDNHLILPTQSYIAMMWCLRQI